MTGQRNRGRVLLFAAVFVFISMLFSVAEAKDKLITKKITLQSKRSGGSKCLSLSEARSKEKADFDPCKDIILWSINGDVELEVGVPSYVHIGKSFEQIKEAPATGYHYRRHHNKLVSETLYVPLSLIKEGKATYCIKTEEGNYVKLNFTSVDLKKRTVTLEWVYRSNKSPKFNQ